MVTVACILRVAPGITCHPYVGLCALIETGPELSAMVEVEAAEEVVACEGGGATSVTLALAEPPGPFAVTTTFLVVPVMGAVYRPEELMVPELAAKLVAFGAVNCRLVPPVTEAEVGEIVCGPTRVTTAVAEPPVPVTVMVAVPLVVIVVGAV